MKILFWELKREFKLIMVFKLSMLESLDVLLHSGCSKRPKIGFQNRLSLNANQKYCRMLQESILQYFRPSLSYHLSLRSLFCLFLSGRFRQVFIVLRQLSTILNDFNLSIFSVNQWKPVGWIWTEMSLKIRMKRWKKPG